MPSSALGLPSPPSSPPSSPATRSRSATEKASGRSARTAASAARSSSDAPFPTSDFSSFLLQAKGSGAQVVGLANAGAATVDAIEQASEFGLVQDGQKLAGLLGHISDVQPSASRPRRG